MNAVLWSWCRIRFLIVFTDPVASCRPITGAAHRESSRVSRLATAYYSNLHALSGDPWWSILCRPNTLEDFSNINFNIVGAHDTFNSWIMSPEEKRGTRTQRRRSKYARSPNIKIIIRTIFYGVHSAFLFFLSNICLINNMVISSSGFLSIKILFESLSRGISHCTVIIHVPSRWRQRHGVC